MKTVSVRRSLTRIGVGALLGVALHSTFAQAPAPPAAQQSGVPTTTIKVSTRLVTIDVIVQDKKNQPVPGLTKDDFDLFEDGQPQSISVFSIEGQAAPGATPPKPLPPGIFSNHSSLLSNAPASRTVILLDGLNTSVQDMAMARAAVRDFLRHLQSQDQVAVYSMGRMLRVNQDFTNDSTLLLNALKAATAEPPGGSGPNLNPLTPDGVTDPTGASAKLAGLWAVPNVDLTLATFEIICKHLAGFPGRKTLIWISSGFPLLLKKPRGGSCNPPDFFDMSPKVQRASQILSKSNVAVYPIDTRGLAVSGVTTPGAFDQPPPPCYGKQILYIEATHDTGSLVAKLTGGRTYYDQNDLAFGIRSAVDDSKLVYVLGYYPAQDKWDSQFHTFKVQVKQPGLKLIYRSGYLATPEPATLTAEDSQTVLEKAAIAPLDSSVIGLFARVQKSGANVQSPTIDLVVDVTDLRLNHDGGRWKGNLDVVIAQLTAEGDLIESAARQHTARLDVQDDYYAKLQASGLQLFFPFAPDPKAATIRVVIRSVVSGAIGTISIPVSAI